MKKIIVGAITLTVASLLIGCESMSAKKADYTSTLAYEATSSLALLSKTTAKNLSTKETSVVDELLPQIELLLQNGSGFNTQSVESDIEEYAYKEIITFNTSLTETASYSLYYNTIQEKVEEEKDDEEEQGEEEVETEISYQGIAKTEDSTYEFEAKVETEQEVDEKETEMKFKLKTKDNSYIQVKQEIEIAENETEEEYKYKVVEDGITTYEYKLSIEQEENEVEVKLVLNNVTYKVKYDESGKTSIKITTVS